MLVFAAVVNDGPQNKEIIELDETIFYRIGAGDKEAFCELYAKTSNAIFSYALSILRNQQDAEDAMQETYLKIRSAAHLYQPEGKPMAWVFTIARNICLMKFRKKNMRLLFHLRKCRKHRIVVKLKIGRIVLYWKRHFEF